MNEIEVDVSKVRFTHRFISNTFKNGGRLADAVKEIRAGVLSPADFPPIRVAYYRQLLWSLDNRFCFLFLSRIFSPTGIPKNKTKQKKTVICISREWRSNCKSDSG
jgi:hypothetical protein